MRMRTGTRRSIMSLSASMWTAVTGLLVHGEKMNVVGNNIANVNTVGFKGSRMDFEDFVNQTVYAASGPSQVGRGAAIGAIYGDFSQGSFENSTNPTDLAINGNGFFKVKPVGQDTEYFTRAGNFRFNPDGYLVDPHGYALQGWRIQSANPSLASSTGGVAGASSGSLKGTGAPGDVKLDSYTCDPKHTNNVMMQLNLSADASSESKSAGDTNPFFAMFEKWDATQDPALGEDAYTYPETMYIYDEGGTKHKITVYFDKVDQTEMIGGVPTNKSYWEYMVTMDPAEDHRDFGTTGVPSNKTKGILMTGTMEFDSAGNFVNQSAYVPMEGGTTGNNLSTWVSAPISSNGYPMFCPNFSGAPSASTAWEDGTYANINPNAKGKLVELNLGLKNTSTTWASGTVTAASAIGKDPANINAMDTAAIEPQPKRSTSYAGASGSLDRSQNGYSFGYLSTVHVDRDGIMYGKYSNGETLALFQIALYDFTSPHNLYREGGNLFSQTRESGDASSGPANSMGLGSVNGNALEQSNVDLATEFVNMITTQRGFQANSKAITTVDTMLETVIGMKR